MINPGLADLAGAEAEARFPGRAELFVASAKVLSELQRNHVLLDRTQPKMLFGFEDDVVFW